MPSPPAALNVRSSFVALSPFHTSIENDTSAKSYYDARIFHHMDCGFRRISEYSYSESRSTFYRGLVNPSAFHLLSSFSRFPPEASKYIPISFGFSGHPQWEQTNK